MAKETSKAVPAVPDGTPLVEKFNLPRTIHLIPLNYIDGFAVRPGFYEINGATAIPGGVNFTVYSHGAASIELLLFHREESEPYAVLPIPQNYRIGNVYSMIVFKLNIEDFEYAYRVDGPYVPPTARNRRGRLFSDRAGDEARPWRVSGAPLPEGMRFRGCGPAREVRSCPVRALGQPFADFLRRGPGARGPCALNCALFLFQAKGIPPPAMVDGFTPPFLDVIRI